MRWLLVLWTRRAALPLRALPAKTGICTTHTHTALSTSSPGPLSSGRPHGCRADARHRRASAAARGRGRCAGRFSCSRLIATRQSSASRRRPWPSCRPCLTLCCRSCRSWVPCGGGKSLAATMTALALASGEDGRAPSVELLHPEPRPLALQGGRYRRGHHPRGPGRLRVMLRRRHPCGDRLGGVRRDVGGPGPQARSRVGVHQQPARVQPSRRGGARPAAGLRLAHRVGLRAHLGAPAADRWRCCICLWCWWGYCCRCCGR